MQHIAIFEEQVAITPKDMRQDIESIDELLLEKLSTNLDGRCSKNGYVTPGSVKILSRSMGALEKGRFTGNILFHVQSEATVLNPSDGSVVEGDVIRKNKMGMYVSYMDAIRVIIPRDLYIGDTAYDAVQIGDTVQVEIKKSRFQVNDPYILSIGYFKGLAAKGKNVPPASVPVEAISEEVITEEPDAEEGGEEAEEEVEEEVEEEAEEEFVGEEDVEEEGGVAESEDAGQPV